MTFALATKLSLSEPNTFTLPVLSYNLSYMEWKFNECSAWLTAGVILQQQDTTKMSNTKQLAGTLAGAGRNKVLYMADRHPVKTPHGPVLFLE